MRMSEQVAPGKRAFAVEARFVVILTIFECSLLFKVRTTFRGRLQPANVECPTATRLCDSAVISQ